MDSEWQLFPFLTVEIINETMKTLSMYINKNKITSYRDDSTSSDTQYYVFNIWKQK